MGWYFQPCTRKQLVEELLEPHQFGTGFCRTNSYPLAHCYRGNPYRGVLWSVWEQRAIMGAKTLGIIARFIRCDDMAYHHPGEWGYKPMEESMGPYVYSCPLSYLEMVPPAIYGGNLDWRDGVRQYHQGITLKRRQRREWRIERGYRKPTNGRSHRSSAQPN